MDTSAYEYVLMRMLAMEVRHGFLRVLLLRCYLYVYICI